MEIITTNTTFNFTHALSCQPFLLASSLTLLSLLLAFITFRSKSPNPRASPPATSAIRACNCNCENGSVEKSAVGSSETESTVFNGGGTEMKVAVVERQTGVSMMEQLVPEITTHALSYLDYPSLCRLSMTNSLMRKAANDDNAWKALYHKDFTREQDSITPARGWKAYYAATRAIMNVNAEFCNIIRERSLSAMRRFWLNADYVKCIHSSSELFSGYDAVIESWQIKFIWQRDANFQFRDMRARVLTDMAWVTMKMYIDIDNGPFHITNTYEFHNGRWYMVHHHCHCLIMEEEVDQQIAHG